MGVTVLDELGEARGAASERGAGKGAASGCDGAMGAACRHAG